MTDRYEVAEAEAAAWVETYIRHVFTARRFAGLPVDEDHADEIAAGALDMARRDDPAGFERHQSGLIFGGLKEIVR